MRCYKWKGCFMDQSLIYMLEDDDSIRQFVLYALKSSGFEAIGFDRPSAFFEAMEKEVPTLVLLDIMLPEQDGMEVLHLLRQNQKTSRIPVIMLTAKSSEYDKVVALDTGADDYLSKPFGTMELISRIKALIRRATNSGVIKEEGEYSAGGLMVSKSKHTVTANGVPVALTFKEFELLCYLFSNMGKVLTRDDILKNVWEYNFITENRTVDVHIRTLRSKLGDCADVIETVRGVGYKIKGD